MLAPCEFASIEEIWFVPQLRAGKEPPGLTLEAGWPPTASGKLSGAITLRL